MTTFALLHGAGDSGSSWHRVAAHLRSHGHDAVTPDLPSEDESARWEDYADAAVEAIGDRTDDLVVVGHSLGGFTAPLVCDRLPTRLLVLVAAMIPAPGESADEWWTTSGYMAAAGDNPYADDPIALYLHDVEPDVAAEAMCAERGQAGGMMRQPWPLDAWPDVPTRYLICSEDRFFPAAWLRDLVRERLGITPDEIETSHAPYLARPAELAERLVAYAEGARLPANSVG